MPSHLAQSVSNNFLLPFFSEGLMANKLLQCNLSRVGVDDDAVHKRPEIVDQGTAVVLRAMTISM
jgi:hypothetical protein